MQPLWWLTKDSDLDCLELYERHYSAYRYAEIAGDAMSNAPAPEEWLEQVRVAEGKTTELASSHGSTTSAKVYQD